MIGSRDPDWLHRLTNLMVGLFQRYGLADNVTKSCLMTCQPGALRSRVSVEDKALKCTGVGESYRVRIQRRIPCLDYGVYLTTGYMMAHHHCIQGK